MSQFTTVTGTVRDPTGRIYQDGSFSVNFVDPGTSGQIASLSNGQPFQTSFSGALDSFGFFSVTVADNGQIASASGEANTKWQFVISASANLLQLPVGVPVPTFSYITAINCSTNTPSLCTSGSIDISIQLQSVAALLPNTGVILFSGVPTGPCTASQTAVDTTTGNFYSCNGGVWQKVGPGTGALSSPVTSPNPIAFDVDVRFKGPDPYIDITRYGARSGATTNSPILTVNCNSGNANVTISGAGDFVNGDGVTLYGCGATLALSTPPAPTVTPSLAAAGTGVGYVVSGPTGSTNYWYTRAARDQAGGLTAASPVTAVTNGQPKLGSQVVCLGTLTRSAAVVTANTAIFTLTAAANASGGNTTYTGTITSSNLPTAITSVVIAGFTNGGNNGTFQFVSATSTTITVVNAGGVAETHAGTAQQQHGLAVGAMVMVNQVVDGSFSGSYNVASVPSSTSFTYNSAADTTAGATASSTGGIIQYFNVNHITWSDDGSWQSYLWVSTVSSSGPWTAIEPSWPGRFVLSDWADDYGSTMETGLVLPYFVPATTPPASALNDPLTTTILNGAGTTTLTLNVAPSNNTSGSTILHDDAPAIVAAYNAAVVNSAMVYIPVGGFAVNSFMTVPTGGNNAALWQQGGLTVNDTISLHGAWAGGIVPRIGTQQFTFVGGAGITTSHAWPAFYLGGSGTRLSDFTMQFQNRNSLGILCDDCLNTTIERSGITSPGGNPDYLSKAFVSKGVFSNNGSWFFFRDNTWTATQSGGTATPFAYCQQCGQVEVRNINLSGRGFMFADGTDADWNHGRIQASNSPVVTLVNAGQLNWTNYELDTTPQPSLNILGSGGNLNPSVNVYMRNVGNPAFDGVSAPPNIAGYLGNSSITNINAGVVSAGVLNTTSWNGIKISNPTQGVHLGQGSAASIGYQLTRPLTAPTVAPTGTGSFFSAGTYFVSLEAVDALGNATSPGVFSAGVTLTAGQNILVTFPAAQPGQVAWNICGGTNTSSFTCNLAPPFQNPGQGFNIPVSLATYTLNGFGSNNANFSNIAAAAGVGATSVFAPNLTVVGGGNTSNITGSFTAARTVTLPDSNAVVIGTSTFANLGTPSNGTFTYCSDCTIANPCAGGGTGALAKRLNGVWVCN